MNFIFGKMNKIVIELLNWFKFASLAQICAIEASRANAIYRHHVLVIITLYIPHSSIIGTLLYLAL